MLDEIERPANAQTAITPQSAIKTQNQPFGRSMLAPDCGHLFSKVDECVGAATPDGVHHDMVITPWRPPAGEMARPGD